MIRLLFLVLVVFALTGALFNSVMTGRAAIFALPIMMAGIFLLSKISRFTRR